MSIVRFLKGVAVAAPFLLFAAEAAAQERCAPRDGMVTHFRDVLKMTPRFVGVNFVGVVITLWGSDETGEWFAVRSAEDQAGNEYLCILTQGSEFVIPVQGAEGTPS